MFVDYIGAVVVFRARSERGSSMRSRHLVAAPPSRRAGLAFPTVLAALVCGGSVLAIAVSGSFALDGSDPVIALPGPLTGVSVVDPAGPAGSAGSAGGPDSGSRRGVTADVTGGPAPTGPGQEASAIPPTGPLRAGARRPATAGAKAAPVPPAATAVDHAIVVHGGGFDDSPVVPADRGPLTAPRVVAAAAPTVIVLDPLPAGTQVADPAIPAPATPATPSTPGTPGTPSTSPGPPSSAPAPSVPALSRPSVAVAQTAAPAQSAPPVRAAAAQPPTRHHGSRHNSRRSRHGTPRAGVQASATRRHHHHHHHHHHAHHGSGHVHG
jgi:hypothetical protein